MTEYVSIKSIKNGIIVYLNPEIRFNELLKEVEKKFTAAAKFFSQSSLAISFENRILSREEEQILIDVISTTAEITIVCIIDNNNTEKELLYKMALKQTIEGYENFDGQFYRGTLKKRQLLEAESSVIILGNVESGAKVMAKGNVVVMGTINGIVHAGINGNRNAFISALNMNPKILKIGDIGVKYRNKLQMTSDMDYIPKIAIVEGERIYIDPLV